MGASNSTGAIAYTAAQSLEEERKRTREALTSWYCTQRSDAVPSDTIQLELQQQQAAARTLRGLELNEDETEVLKTQMSQASFLTVEIARRLLTSNKFQKIDGVSKRDIYYAWPEKRSTIKDMFGSVETTYLFEALTRPGKPLPFASDMLVCAASIVEVLEPLIQARLDSGETFIAPVPDCD